MFSYTMKKIFLFILLTTLLFSSCEKEEIGKTGLISDKFFLENRGAKMPVLVEGNIDSDQMLIILHGGPGTGAAFYNSKQATEIAEKKFAIVYFDQRAAGSSQGDASDVSLEAYAEDLKKLIAVLRFRYCACKKIYVWGHSWGGFLAPYFLTKDNNQSLVSGWIQVDGAHDYVKNDSLTSLMLRTVGAQEIAAGRHADDWQKIVDYCNSHDPKNNYAVTMQLNLYSHQAQGYMSDINTEPSPFDDIFSSNLPLTANIGNQLYNTIKEIDKQAFAENIDAKLPNVKTPTLLLWGKYDFTCPIGLREDIKQKIGTTNVQEKLFEHSGHAPMFNEPELFWQTVATWMDAH